MKPFDQHGTFSPWLATGGDTLRKAAVRGAGATLLSGMMGLGIQVTATIVLARILAPRDFGVVTIVTTFSLLLSNFGFNGLTEAIVQRESVNERLASTLFWINVTLGLVLTAGFAATGTLLARFFHEPQVRGIATGISLSIVATSVSVVHLALLKRAMRFSQVSLNDICARLASVVVSIGAGFAGWGYWALVAGAVVQPLAASIGAIILCQWMPGRPRRDPGARPTLLFALHTYGNFAVNYASRNTDNLLVGWRFDAVSLGFYKKAYDLFALAASQFVSSITVVVLAALSRLNRDMAEYRRHLLGAITTMAFVGMGLAATLTLVGRDVIRVLLGARWEPSGHIFTLFAPGIGMMMLYYTHGWIHLSIGRADRWFRWAFIEFTVTCTLFFLALRWGPEGIASAWTVSFWVMTLPALWYAGRPIGFGVRPVFAAIWRYVVAAAVGGSATYLVLRAIPSLTIVPGLSGAILRIAVVSSFLMVFYVAAVIVLHGGMSPIYQLLELMRDMIPARRAEAGVVDTCTPAATVEVGTHQQGTRELPLVSILIPAYNAEEWISDTLQSAIAQTWPRKEIIVVDDGSKDGTVVVARKFESQGVRVVTQKNQGASAARNTAYSLSTGDYIQWLDADDLLAPDKVAKQMELVELGVSKRTLLSGPWGHFMYRANRAKFDPSSLWCDLSPVECLLRKMERNVFMQTSTWLVSKELSEAAGPWDTRLLGDDDGEYFCRVLLAADAVRFVPEAKVFYRTFHFSSLSYIGQSQAKIEAHWLSMQLHMKYLRSRIDSPRARRACVIFMQDSMIYFHPENPHIVRQAKKIARELGYELSPPYLSWKYAWIRVLFGWALAKPAQQKLRQFRWSIERRLDKALFALESRNSS